MAPFDPQNITPDVSLNRVRIVDLPGVAIDDPHVRGSVAFRLLSAETLAAHVRQQAGALGLNAPESADRGALLKAFDKCFSSTNPATCRVAEEIARWYGRRLGYLLLTLKRCDPINREARPEWDDSYWAYWAKVRNVWLGGGLVSGRLGPLAVSSAQETLALGGVSDCTLRLAEHPSALPLLGAARTTPLTSRAALVFDFGGSFAKRAWAEYREGELAALHLMPSVPMPDMTIPPMEEWEAKAQELAHYMVSVIADAWSAWESSEAAANEVTLAPFVPVSLANYLRDGQPIGEQGGLYGILPVLSGDVAQLLSDEVRERIGKRVKIHFMHDGTVAATAYAGEPDAAVIMLGTALGVGFPPPSQGLWPLASNLQVIQF